MTAEINKPPVDDEDPDLDLFLDKISNEYKDHWTEENWESEMERHPFFMTQAPSDDTELAPAVEALRQLKWDPDESPSDRAIKLKDEGNLYFKHNNYKSAVVSYTKALAEDISSNKELSSTLHSNRAAAHFYIKNYRSALNDCVFARKMNTNNVKAIYKGAECCFKLNLFDDCVKWCDKLLSINSADEKSKELRAKCEVGKKTYEKEKRKKEAALRKKVGKHDKILGVIKARGVQIEEKDDKFVDLIETPINYQQKSVCLSPDESTLIWPVIILYPEYGQTDFIQSFDENSTLEDHLKVVLAEAPEWDTTKTYTNDKVQVYYENLSKHQLKKLSQSNTLLKCLQKDGFIVQLGTPKFIIMVKDSKFEKMYLDKYNQMFQ